MTLDELKASDGTSLHGLLLALWHDARGDWEQAHAVAQEIDTPDGAWVHAYLHRKEGDRFNAGYWYRLRAGPAPPLPCLRSGTPLPANFSPDEPEAAEVGETASG